jgi:hypothetical protein
MRILRNPIQFPKISESELSEPIPVPVLVPVPAAVSAPVPAAAPEAAPPVMQVLDHTGPSEILQAQLKKDFEELKRETFSELRQFEGRLTREVSKLTEEIAAIRQVLQDLPKAITPSPAPPAAPPPTPVPPPIVSLPVEKPKPVETPAPHFELPNDFGDAVELPSENNPGKVALFKKLWDYLNQVAFEIPLKKSDRSN